MQVNTPEHVFSRSREFGMRFQTESSRAGLALALGVQEVRPVDLVTAYGTLANGGKYIGHTTILSITDRAGKPVVPPYTPPEGVQAASPQAAFIVTDMLAGNTNPRVNPFWGKFAIEDADGTRRPATLKTGTNNDAKDLNAYGFIAPPSEDGRAAGEFALAVGAWNGNSDNSNVSTAARPVFSIDVTTYVWQGFMQEASREWAVNSFARPDGLVKAEIDPFTGLPPQPGGTAIEEWFIEGTVPQSALPEGVCGAEALQYVGFERNYDNWLIADRNWINRASRGAGVSGGVNKTRTSYFYNGSYTPYGKSWGALVEGRGCVGPSPSPTPSCIPLPTPDASGVIPSFVLPTPDPSGGVVALPCPTPVPSASVEPSAEPTIEPTPPPTPEPTPPPTPEPTPPPTPEPTPEPSVAPAEPSP
jgi:membrane peptidoglycan carboxypeptidase